VQPLTGSRARNWGTKRPSLLLCCWIKMDETTDF